MRVDLPAGGSLTRRALVGAIVMSTGPRLAVTFAPAAGCKHGSKLGKTQVIMGNSQVFVGNPGHWVNLGPRGKRDSRELEGSHNDWCSQGSCSHWRKLAPREAKVCPIWSQLESRGMRSEYQIGHEFALVGAGQGRIILAAGLDLR
jgi:hypothetical protein